MNQPKIGITQYVEEKYFPTESKIIGNYWEDAFKLGSFSTSLPHFGCGASLVKFVQPRSMRGTAGLPAVTIGLTHGNGAHTVHEHIEIEPLKKGLEQVVRQVSRVGG